MCSRASKSNCNENAQPFSLSNFSSCVVILEILFKENQGERFVKKAWPSGRTVYRLCERT